MWVELRDQGFDPYTELMRHQTETLGQSGQFGATCSFVGTMRDFNEGDRVSSMLLEYYPGMTEKYLDRILEEARRQWGFLDALIIHRVGEVFPNDPIVLVAVWSSHRAVAFDSCRSILEELKSRAPFWKKETMEEGTRWVEKNTAGV
jgi:molybdopterin synthase catalytic subunit